MRVHSVTNIILSLAPTGRYNTTVSKRVVHVCRVLWHRLQRETVNPIEYL